MAQAARHTPWFQMKHVLERMYDVENSIVAEYCILQLSLEGTIAAPNRMLYTD